MTSRNRGRQARTLKVWDVAFVGKPLRGPCSITFRYDAMKNEMKWIRVRLATSVGTVERVVPLHMLTVHGAAGTGALTIDLTRVPGGKTEVGLTPVNDKGQQGGPSTTSFVVPGQGASAGERIGLSLAGSRIVRPGQGELVFVRGSIASSSVPNATALLVNVKGPDGGESLLDLPPTPKRNVAIMAIGARMNHTFGA